MPNISGALFFSYIAKEHHHNLYNQIPSFQAHYSNNHIRIGSSASLSKGITPYLANTYIVCDANIYNYRDLAKILNLPSKSSQEYVILSAYNKWGKDCVKYLQGKFAFAIWDENENKLFLARDHCGECPLLYFHSNQQFIFASEIKDLIKLLPTLPNLSPAAVDMYLHYQYTPEPFTLFENIYKLSAGHTMVISYPTSIYSIEQYWCVEWSPDIPLQKNTKEKTISELTNQIEKAVVTTLPSNNDPFAIPLSGGLDSGSIAYFAKKHSDGHHVKAVSIGYPGCPPYDERKQAQDLAKKLGIEFHDVEVTTNELIEFFPKLSYVMDEPIADPAAFAHYIVAKTIKNMGMNIALSGIGGDEIFHGYSWVSQAIYANKHTYMYPKALKNILAKPKIAYWINKKINSKKTSIPLRSILKSLLISQLDKPSDQLDFYGRTPDFNYATKFLKTIYGSAMHNLNPYNAFQPMDIGNRKYQEVEPAITSLLYKTWLVGNCLTLNDRLNRFYHIDCRAPFLNVNLIQHVMSIHRSHQDYRLGQKALMREALKNILPQDVLARQKAGFQPPVQEWLEKIILNYSSNIENGYLYHNDFINKSILDILNKKHLQFNQIFMLYKIILLETWYQEITRSCRDSI